MSNEIDLRKEILGLVGQYYRENFASKIFDPSRDMVHYGGRVFTEEELCNLVDASLDFYLTANRYAERFEAEFAAYLGVSNALLVN
jgi:CDP-4-dehydro-6-deoxyglucose reductase, E1